MLKFDRVIKASLAAGMAVAMVLGGCSSGGDDGSTSAGAISGKDGGKSNGPDVSKLQGFASFHPAGEAKVYHSGYDGTNEYVTPVAFFADKAPKVTFGDGNVAELNGPIFTVTKSVLSSLPDSLDGKLHLIFVKSKASGETTISATSGSINQTATIKITQYKPEDVTVGENRYNKGAPSCNSCHASLKVHNPTVLGDLSDDTILGIAVDGKSIQQVDTATGKVETLQPNDGNHKWTVTEAERVGLMAYLRSRPLTFQLPSGAKQ